MAERYDDDDDDATTTAFFSVCNAVRRKPPKISCPSTPPSSHPHQQLSDCPSLRRTTTRNGKNSRSRSGITVTILVRSSMVFLLYNLLVLVFVIQNSRKSKVLLTAVVTKNHHSSKEAELVHHRLVQQTAFTNMIPPSQNGTTGNVRRSKATTSSKKESLSPLVTLNLYDIYNDPLEVSRRSMRFPSMEQRLKVYLSTWYIPPCPSSDDRHKVQYKYKDADMKMVVFQPLHFNNTVSTLSTSASQLSDTLESQQQRRQLRAMEKTSKAKKNQQLKPKLDGNDATAIPNNLIYTVDTTISHKRHLLLYHSKVMEDCNDPFCTDVLQFIQPSLNRILPSPSSSTLSQPTTSQQQQQLKYDALAKMDKFPILFQFGDAELFRSYVPARQLDVYSPMVPVLRKYRYSIAPSDLHQITSGRVATNVNSSNSNDDHQEPLQCYSVEERRIIAGTVRNPTVKTQAIISIVSNYPRHFEPLNHVNDADIAWESKLNMAVYRGALTGRNKADYKSSDLNFCVQVPRCNLVYQHGNSSLVDAMLVPYGKMKYPLSDPLDGVKMFGNPMSMEEMLKYKAIVMLEGNDVSSGLKWALFSNSVVLTQAPTCTSWAMEELLVPWVHYIPINDDLSDVEEKVQWILDHDDEARAIARNGRLWIADLVYHPDADEENEMIIDETMRRYSAHFAYNPSLKE